MMHDRVHPDRVDPVEHGTARWRTCRIRSRVSAFRSLGHSAWLASLYCMTIVIYWLDDRYDDRHVKPKFGGGEDRGAATACAPVGRTHPLRLDRGGVMFVVILATVGVRAAPGVLIVPLEQAFGWNAATISGAISLNILLGGLIGPFAAAMLQTIGLRRTVVAHCCCCCSVPAGSAFARDTMGAVCHLGRAGGRRLRRRHGRAWRRRWRIAGSSPTAAWSSAC